MQRKREMPRFNRDGPENEFRGKLPKVSSQVGKRYTISLGESTAVSLKLDAANSYGNQSQNIIFKTVFTSREVGTGIRILLGKFDRRADREFGFGGPFLNFITKHDLVDIFMVAKLTSIRERITTNAENIASAKRLSGLAETLEEGLKREGTTSKNPSSQAVATGNAKQDIKIYELKLCQAVRRAEVLKEAIDAGAFTYLIHIPGDAAFSSTQAMLSIGDGNVTFTALQDQWGEPLNDTQYRLIHLRNHSDMIMTLGLE